MRTQFMERAARLIEAKEPPSKRDARKAKLEKERWRGWKNIVIWLTNIMRNIELKLHIANSSRDDRVFNLISLCSILAPGPAPGRVLHVTCPKHDIEEPIKADVYSVY